MTINALRSKHISRRLWLAMLLIVFFVVLMGLPLIISSYRDYQKSSEALLEIQSLKMMAELANKVSKERAPANNAMSSTRDELPERLHALNKHRIDVDIQVQQTIDVLNQTGFEPIAQELQRHFKPALALGRQAVDHYIHLSDEQRNMPQLDGAIFAMFTAWDENYAALKKLMSQFRAKDSSLSNDYTLILLLADFRDQAGRSASNILAAVSLKQRIPDENLARSMQTQRQTKYLWELVGIVQHEKDKTSEFVALYQRVKTEFLDQGQPIIEGLMKQSLNGQSYSMTGPQLTQAIVTKFSSVVDLQNYILEYSVRKAQNEQRYAQKKLIYAILVLLVSLLTIFLIMVYAKKWVFEPLILARKQLIELAQLDRKNLAKAGHEEATIFEAIGRVQKKLKQREALEFQLKHIAHSDALTGIANRFALDEYIKILEKQPSQFNHSCLIIIDIDNFKQVNDTYGHIAGDLVIQAVAENLKNCVRPSDLLVRYGGDEFLVLIENIGLETALKIAEKIRKKILRSEIFQQDEFELVNISISAGVAVGAASWMGLLAKADEALFRAKAKGKNAVDG